MKFVVFYYIFTLSIFLYNIIKVITTIDFSKKLGIRELLKNNKVDVIILSESVDDILLLNPIILELEKQNIKSFIGIYDTKSEEILKKQLLDSSMISLKKYNNIQDTIYSLYKYKPKVLLIVNTFSNYTFYLFSKLLRIKIITIEAKNNTKKNFLLKKISNIHYSITSEIKNDTYNISNIKILSSSSYISNNLLPKNKDINLTLVISDNKNNLSNIIQIFSDKIKSQNKFIFIIPLDFKFDIINLLKFNKYVFFCWDEQPFNYNLILNYFDCIICFNKYSLNYWASICEIAILDKPLKNNCTMTLSTLALNKCCILLFNDKLNKLNNYLFKENIILLVDDNNLKKNYSSLFENNLINKYQDNSYEWISNLRQKADLDVKKIVNQIKSFI